MVQYLRTLAALPKNPGLVPSSHTVLIQLSITPVPEGSMPSSKLRGYKPCGSTYTYIQNKINI